eukprot:8685084-Prorocentrum_lima.AAC.1
MPAVRGRPGRKPADVHKPAMSKCVAQQELFPASTDRPHTRSSSKSSSSIWRNTSGSLATKIRSSAYAAQNSAK